MKYFLFLTLFLPQTLFAIQKDSIYVSQFVRNAFTQYGVRNAFVAVFDSEGNLVDTLRTKPGNGGHDASIWTLVMPRREATFRVRVEHPDYETGEMTVTLKHPARLNSFRCPDMLLKRKFKEMETELGEVTVRATRVKLCYKGDTIEVNANAFKLTEGSMLESLVHNVPGCELHDNGDIYMNGRKVDYLTLNGKDFFKGNNRIMLDNLPYYTVDKLQFFNKSTERSQLTGKDMERPDYVMDVRLKQEYSIGYMGNVEAGVGTHERWMGRGFALRFTDNSRLSLFANSNNINEAHNSDNSGNWSQQRTPIGDKRTANVGGELLVDDKHGRYKEVLNASLLWNRAYDKTRTTSQQFLQQGDVFGYGSDVTAKHDFAFKINNDLTLKRIGLVSKSRFDYSSHDNDALMRSAQLSARPSEGAEQVIDSIFGINQSNELMSMMMNNVRNNIIQNGSKWAMEQKLDYHKGLPWGDDLMLTANGMWSGMKDNAASSYRLRYSDASIADDSQERRTEAWSRSYQLHFGVNYAIHFLSNWHMSLGLAHEQRHSNERTDLYRLDWDEDFRPDKMLPSQVDYLHLRDDGNSPHNLNTQCEDHINVSLHRHNYDRDHGRFFSFTTALNVRYAWQDGTYSRGENIARQSDHRWLFNPKVDIEYQTRQWHDTYRLHYDTEMHTLALAQSADQTDTSNPLAVLRGNPDLRPSHTHNLSLTFSSRFGTRGQFIMLQTHTAVMRDFVAMNSVYNSKTGGYTFMPVNVNGNWNSRTILDMRRALTKERNLNIESSTAYNYLHSVDMKDNVQSIVTQHVVEQNLKVEYKHKKIVAALLGSTSCRNICRIDFDNISSVDFSYGANLQVNLPWDAHLSTDIKMYSRRGYTDRSLCTDNLLWNAQLNHAFCHGNLHVTAKAFDLLRQM